jgi:dienelactone hydrolase
MNYKNKAWSVIASISLSMAACGGGAGGGSAQTSGPTLKLSMSQQALWGTVTAWGSGPVNSPSSFWSNTLYKLLQSSGGTTGVFPNAAPPCGVDSYAVTYNTTGAANESGITATGALMLPTGTAAACNGPRPILLYAHGTSSDQTFNIADYAHTHMDVAAMFAAQGYIVVAPNYAGYDASNLTYHPYLNAAQQSADMIAMLGAAQAALPKITAVTVTDSGKLFVAGYSQGGFVAMATLQALEKAGHTVTAAAPMSGPYALNAMADYIMKAGQVDWRATVFVPMVATSYQKAYHNIYTAPTDLYSATYASVGGVSIENLLPSKSASTLYSGGHLPLSVLFNSAPAATAIGAYTLQTFAPPTVVDPIASVLGPTYGGFGTSFLVTDAARVAYITDAIANPDFGVPTQSNSDLSTGGVGLPNAPMPCASGPFSGTTSPSCVGLRQATYLNDMRHFTNPLAPVLLCGGHADPTVFFFNATDMKTFWSAQSPSSNITVLDIDQNPIVTDAFRRASS